MGKKLTSDDIVALVKERPLTVTFNNCSVCDGIEEHQAMQFHDPDGDSFDLICDECLALEEAKKKADWGMMKEAGNTQNTQFYLGALVTSGGINHFKDTVVDLADSLGGNDSPNYISDFIFAVEAEYQAFYGLHHDNWDTVHHNYDQYKDTVLADPEEGH